MPTQLSWFLENRVMLLTSHGAVSDQDLFDIDQPVIDYLNQSNAPLVHLIIDHRDATTTPSVKASTQLKWPKHPRNGWGIMVGLTNPIQRFMVAVATNFF